MVIYLVRQVAPTEIGCRVVELPGDEVGYNDNDNNIYISSNTIIIIITIVPNHKQYS